MNDHSTESVGGAKTLETLGVLKLLSGGSAGLAAVDDLHQATGTALKTVRPIESCWPKPKRLKPGTARSVARFSRDFRLRISIRSISVRRVLIVEAGSAGNGERLLRAIPI